LYYLENKKTKIGWTATKKLGNAVIRNKAKRLLRAVFLVNEDKLNYGTFVFVAKSSLIEDGFHQAKKDMYWALNKLRCFDA